MEEIRNWSHSRISKPQPFRLLSSVNLCGQNVRILCPRISHHGQLNPHGLREYRGLADRHVNQTRTCGRSPRRPKVRPLPVNAPERTPGGAGFGINPCFADGSIDHESRHAPEGMGTRVTSTCKSIWTPGLSRMVIAASLNPVEGRTRPTDGAIFAINGPRRRLP